MTAGAKLAAAAIGVLLAAAVSVAVIAYDQAHRTEAARQVDRVRSNAEIARIARTVFRQETRAQRAARIANAAIEALAACEPKPECVQAGRRLFGPSRARLRAYARWAAREQCRLGRCRGGRGPRGVIGARGAKGDMGRRGHAGRDGNPGVAGRDGEDGRNGAPGASADDVIAELCRRPLMRLVCRRRSLRKP